MKVPSDSPHIPHHDSILPHVGDRLSLENRDQKKNRCQRRSPGETRSVGGISLHKLIEKRCSLPLLVQKGDSAVRCIGREATAFDRNDC
ncbi:hypothetical protein V22_30590 [Calycomorphotria hydatis]|uniref:Uncharacterized protein n=1 Tax=Calycomorphotria hydatis TaxID=2528027 RepID=A0A517TBP7_9PLAN|nr:hypothetical protein V22_30590 [Calycomorphotria hydatis]